MKMKEFPPLIGVPFYGYPFIPLRWYVRQTFDKWTVNK